MKKLTTVGGSSTDSDYLSDAQPEPYVRIGDMAREHGVTLRALRFYEDKGLLAPRREGASRLYTRRDKARLKLILLGRRIGFTLRDVKHIMDLYDPENANVKQIRLVLEKSEKQLSRLQEQRLALEEAIEELQALMARMHDMMGDKTSARAASR